jgi:hypothetical protein
MNGYINKYEKQYIQPIQTPDHMFHPCDSRRMDAMRPDASIQLDRIPYEGAWKQDERRWNNPNWRPMDYGFSYGSIGYYSGETNTPYLPQVFGHDSVCDVDAVVFKTPMDDYHTHYYANMHEIDAVNQNDKDDLTFRNDLYASYSRRLNRSRYGMQF